MVTYVDEGGHGAHLKSGLGDLLEKRRAPQPEAPGSLLPAPDPSGSFRTRLRQGRGEAATAQRGEGLVGAWVVVGRARVGFEKAEPKRGGGKKNPGEASRPQWQCSVDWRVDWRAKIFGNFLNRREGGFFLQTKIFGCPPSLGGPGRVDEPNGPQNYIGRRADVWPALVACGPYVRRGCVTDLEFLQL